MATYQVETSHGTYEVETSDEPQWSDLPGNAIEGLKEGPQTAVGLLNSAKMGNDLTDPISLARSAGQAVTGTPLADTDAGQAVQGVKEGLKGTMDTIRGIPDVLSHPLQSAKREIIEHPISSAVNVASLAAPVLDGAAETAGRYAGRMGENQMGKLHGTSAYQFRQLGRENFGDAMRASYEHGDANLLQGTIGREQAINERVAQLGNDIGDVRSQAAEAGPAMKGPEMADAIQKNLQADYSPSGVKFDQAGRLQAQLDSISKMKDPSVEDYAQRATDINHEASKNKLVQPTGTDTDVANQMAHINDEQIAKRLPPEIQEHYQMLKDEFGNAKSIQPMELRAEAKEATGKAVSGTPFGMAKDILHGLAGGPKMGAQVGFGAEKALNTFAANPKTFGVAGITSTIMSRLQTDPQSLGKFAAPLSQAAQSGGQQGIAATHFVLSHQYPEYNAMFMGDSDESGK
jgi:hypothetical protein